MKRSCMFNILAFLLIGFILFLIFLALRQDKMIFFPEKLERNTRFHFDFPFVEHFFEVEPGVELHYLHAKTKTPKGLVFYLHGNAGSLESWGDICPRFLRQGFEVIVYDYRGYGKSDGEIRSEPQLMADSEALLKFVLKKWGPQRVVLYGRSLGTGIAAGLAAKHDVDHLVLETPYRSFTKLVRNHYFFVPSFLVKYRLDTETHLTKVNCPVSIIHGTDDAIIPVAHSRILKQRFPNIHYVEVPGGAHNDLEIFSEYDSFLKRALRTETDP